MYEYEYKTLEELSHRAVQHDIRIAEVVIRHEMETSEQAETAVRQCMASRLEVFRESIEAGLSDTGTSVSGLVGGDADKLAHSRGRLLGSLARKAEMYALAVSEANAKMFKIVACPTAGSCGIVPAVLTAVSEELGTSPQENVEALFTAAGIGAVVARNASVAGAVGGCQAECGTAAAMAAAAITELAGGTPHMVSQAVAIALKNILGLVCDPVAGLVEIPCIKRNASGVAGAFVAAEMALAGIDSAIPADEVIWSMKRIGDVMSPTLKETAEGGLAATPTGRKLHDQVFGPVNVSGGCSGCSGCHS